MVTFVLALAGCGPQRMRFKHPNLITESDAAAYAQVALDHENPDTRREAIAAVGKSRHRTNESVIRAISTVAREDASHAVRHAAVHALGEAGTPAIIDPLLEIISASDEAPALERLPSAEVRYAAMQGLDPLLVRDELTDVQRTSCRTASLRLLQRNPSRDVRIAAALLLRHYPEREVADGLIDSLRQRDFGVVYECDRSLMHLTGRRHNHDAAAWKQWFSSSGEPFAEGGRLDPEIYPPEKSFWQRTSESARRVLAGYKPK